MSRACHSAWRTCPELEPMVPGGVLGKPNPDPWVVLNLLKELIEFTESKLGWLESDFPLVRMEPVDWIVPELMCVIGPSDSSTLLRHLLSPEAKGDTDQVINSPST